MNIHMALPQRPCPLFGKARQVSAVDNSATCPRVTLMTDFLRPGTVNMWVNVDLTPREARELARQLLEGADEADAFTGAGDPE